MENSADNGYYEVSDQAKRLVYTRWEARFWSTAMGALGVAAVAIPLLMSGGALPIAIGVAAGLGAVFSKFKSDETWTEYDILSHTVAEAQASSIFAQELGKEQRRMMQYEQKLQQEIDKQQAMNRNNGTDNGYDSGHNRNANYLNTGSNNNKAVDNPSREVHHEQKDSDAPSRSASFTEKNPSKQAYKKKEPKQNKTPPEKKSDISPRDTMRPESKSAIMPRNVSEKGWSNVVDTPNETQLATR